MRHVISSLLLVSATLSGGPARAAQTPQNLEYEVFCKIADVQERRTAFLATTPENRATLVRTQLERWRDANKARLNAKQLDVLAGLIAAVTPEAYGPKAAEARAKIRPLEEAMSQLFTRDEIEAMQPTGPCIAKVK